MNSRELILKLLEYARRAPSADNSQPWQFKIKNKTIQLYHNKTNSETNHLYNIDYFADYIGLGAVVKNIETGAKSMGAEIELSFPFTKNLIAEINIFESENKINPALGKSALRRHTNRNFYSQKPLNLSIEKKCKDIAEKNEAKLYWITDQGQIRKLSEAMAPHSKILWEDICLRENILSKINMEERKKLQYGIPLSALELGWKKPFFKTAIKAAKNIDFAWKIIGINSKIYTQKQICKSGVICVLTMPQIHDPKTYIHGGRILEQIWIYLTHKGVAMQPLFGPIDLILNSRLSKKTILRQHQKIQQNTSDFFYSKFSNLENETLIAIFRAGYSDKESSSLAPRKNIEDLLI